MEDDDDIVEVTVVLQEERNPEERPLMKFLKRLIKSKDNEQKIIIPNAHLKEILQKDFEQDDLHQLQEEIYLGVLKKFILEWPEWDHFNLLKGKGDNDGLNAELEVMYKSMRKYLKLMIGIAMPFAREAVKKLETTTTQTAAKSNNFDDVVLEVYSSRAQLNKLFFKQPYPNENGTIFNIDDSGPLRIRSNRPTVAGILNSFGVCVALTINCVTITRFTCHDIDHVLVNKKLDIPRQKCITVPKETLQMNKQFKTVDVEKKDIIDSLTKEYKKFKSKNFIEAMTVLEVLIRDLAEGPVTFKYPARYRKYMSKYAYRRYLNAELPVETKLSDKYDIHLEETICPRYQYTIHRYGKSEEKMYNLQIECMQCDLKFKGDNVLSNIEEHYLGLHSQEADVKCTNCNKMFSVDYLTDKRWHHECHNFIA